MSTEPKRYPNLTRWSTCTGLLLLVALSLVGLVNPTSAAVVYRIGGPLSMAEQDSLEDLEIDFREISWNEAETLHEVDLDRLQDSTLQPNFFDPDENIAATVLGRGGVISILVIGNENTLIGQVLLDEDETTFHTFLEIAHESFTPSYSAGVRDRITLDLGGDLLVQEVRFRPRLENPAKFVEKFRIGMSLEPFNYFKYPTLTPIVEIKENTNPDVRVSFDPPITTRVVQLQILRESPKELELTELEIFGTGFVASSSYVSDVIELDDRASWGEIRWSGRRDPQARIEINTRTGSDPQPEVFWRARPEQQDSVRYLDGGGDLSAREYRERYEGLPNIFKPEDERHRITSDTENWSSWSSPYLFDQLETEILSPGPRRFIQLRADFVATVTDGGQIDFIEFKASVPPSVRGLVGEVYPVEARLGEVTHFTYYISPTVRAGDRGFDGIEITAPSGITSVDSLRIAGVDQENFTWSMTDDGSGFEVWLPRTIEVTDSGSLIEVVFNAPLFREVGNFFDGKVFNSQTPLEVRQQVHPGDAAEEVESELLSVTTTLAGSILFSPRAYPNPFTPNGDGINDRLRIDYTLLRVTSPIRVSVAIYDLAGARVEEVYAGQDPIGAFSRFWDGTNSADEVVAPGIYLYRIDVETQTREEAVSGVVSVVY